MSVVGFDIGNENCVIATTKNRGIDVLLNDESKRETPTMVSFGEKQRFLGAAAAASATMNPKSTISQIKRLIGLNFRQPCVQEELQKFPFQTSEGPDGSVLIHLNYLGETVTFTPVQILAMLLSHLKEITEKNLEAPISDCAIGIPSYFTDTQRRAYLNAAAIAGLRPLRLLHDCTAIALGYGIYKTDFSNAGPTYVVFIDIGHCDTQVSVVSFDAGHMKIISHAFDSCLGGRDFDEILFNYFAAQFKEQYHIDVYSNVRACIRLRTACEKLKKVLSANAEAPLNIECLMDEKDVKGYIKREEFERLSSGLLERIQIPCNKALSDAGLTVHQIQSVELVGSGSRVPAITRILASLFQREPSRTLNASECVARGCALQCAMLSPIFRVRDYEVQDSFPFSVGFSSEEGLVCTSSSCLLFPKGQSIPSSKFLTLHRNKTFHLEAFYIDQSELPSSFRQKFSCFTIGPFQVSNSKKAKVKVKVQLNLHGIVSVESAWLLEDPVDDNGTMDLDSNLDRVEASNPSGVSPDTVLNHAEEGKSSRRFEIPVSEMIFGGMTKAELSEAQEKEIQLVQQDRIIEQTKNQKNALEGYVYDMRNKLFNTYRSFATDSEREDISRSLQQTEDWLYEDGDDESEKVYIGKLDNLKKLVDPIENRYKDEEARAQATRDLLKCVVDNRMAAKSLPSSDKDVVLNECFKAEQWLREKTQQQDSLPKNTDPILLSSEIRRKTELLDKTCKQILRSKSPFKREDTSDSNQPNSPDKKETD